MKLNKIIVLSLSAIFLSTNLSFAQKPMTLDFEQARQMAINNSEKLKLQDEMIDSLSKKNALQQSDPHQNKPDYEYNGITKTEVYNNTYKTYDYEKILKNITREKESEIFASENKTFNFYKTIYDLEKQIQDKNLAITNQQKIVYQNKVKLKNKLITQLTLDMEKNKLDLLKLQLADLQRQIALQKSQFKKHLGIDEKTDIVLTITEPDISTVLNPKDALAQAMLKNNSFVDLKDDMDELLKDMKWIDLLNQKGTVEQQQELIDKKKEDINEKTRTSLYSYDKTVNQILVLTENLRKDKIENEQLNIEKQKNALLNKSGLTTLNTYDATDYQISQNLLSQVDKVIKIRQLMLDYYTDINL